MTTELAKRGERRLRRQNRILNLVYEAVDEPIEVVTTIHTTHNGRLVPMSLPKVNWLERADQTIKRLDQTRR